MALTAPFPAPRATARATARMTTRNTSRRASQQLRVAATGAGARKRPLRLTTRGRVVLLAATILALFAVVVAFGGFTAEATGAVPGPGVGPVAAVVVVQPGESLWSIAQQVAPGSDPRETVSRIRDLNGLADAIVTPGQSLVVPAIN